MLEEDIEQVIQHYKSVVYGIALTKLGNRFDADDVFQEVFLTYYRKQKVFHGEEHRKAWLIRTTLNFCKKIMLSPWKKRQISVDLEMARGSFQFQLPEENDIYEALQTLPEKYRIALYLFYFESYSTEEVGKLLKIRGEAVRMRLNRGRELMKQQLKGVTFDEK